MNDFTSLLPTNSTALEKRLERTLASRLDAMDGDYGTIDPLTCDVKMLPVLAWLFRVTYWDTDWPEEVKRRVIAAQPFIKRHCGTVSAVETALSVFSVRANIIEWFNQTPNGPRGSFSVKAFAGSRLGAGAILTTKLAEQIKSAINYSKPASRPFDLQLGVEASARMIIGAALNGALKQREMKLTARPRTDSRAAISMASACWRPLKILNIELGLAL